EKGQRNSNGINNYEFMDGDAKSGMNFYRVKVVGLDSPIKYSNEVNLNISSKVLVDVYPNPFFDRLYVTPVQSLEEDAIVEIFTETGILIYQSLVPKDSQGFEIKMDGTRDFSKMIFRIRYKESGKYLSIPLIHRRAK
ncbi:MAG: hypothetical protein HKN16_08965, partial [Saprospiraceae bacterium]|nr:hypothetical protein [Saprospiraceae bacterium]